MIISAKRIFKKKKERTCFEEFAKSINLRNCSNYTWNKSKIFKNEWVKLEPSNDKECLKSVENIHISQNTISLP